MREWRLEITRATTSRVKLIEAIPTRVKPIKAIPIVAMPISRTLAQDMSAVRRYARMGTIPITRMLARRTASTVRNGSLAERLSVSARGITGAGGTADIMAARVTTVTATTDVAIMDMLMLEDEGMPADTQVTMRAAATPEADTMVAAQFTAAVGITAEGAVVAASTAAVDMVAGTGNPTKSRVMTAGSVTLPAVSNCRS